MGKYLDIARQAIRERETTYDKNDRNDKSPLPHHPSVVNVVSVVAPDSRSWRAEDWRAHYEERAAIRQHLGGYDRTTAEMLAYGELLTDWHRERGAKPDPARCAGCGFALAGRPAHAFPDGAGVHTDRDLECWTAYGVRWRAAAAEALARLGIARPEGWDP